MGGSSRAAPSCRPSTGSARFYRASHGIAERGETVLGAGRAVGAVTSEAYGYSLGRGVAYAWLRVAPAVTGAPVEVDWFGGRLGAHVTDNALWDPAGRRVRTPNNAARTPNNVARTSQNVARTPDHVASTRVGAP